MKNHPLQEFIPLTHVPELLQFGGRRPSHACVWRWVVKGIDGIRLNAIRIGRKWYTTHDHIESFGQTLAARSIERLNPSAASTAPAVPTRTHRKVASSIRRETEISRAEQNLKQFQI